MFKTAVFCPKSFSDRTDILTKGKNTGDVRKVPNSFWLSFLRHPFISNLPFTVTPYCMITPLTKPMTHMVISWGGGGNLGGDLTPPNDPPPTAQATRKTCQDAIGHWQDTLGIASFFWLWRAAKKVPHKNEMNRVSSQRKTTSKSKPSGLIGHIPGGKTNLFFCWKTGLWERWM